MTGRAGGRTAIEGEETFPVLSEMGELETASLAGATISQMREWIRRRLEGHDVVPLDETLGDKPHYLFLELNDDASVSEEARYHLRIGALELLHELADDLDRFDLAPGDELLRLVPRLLYDAVHVAQQDKQKARVFLLTILERVDVLPHDEWPEDRDSTFGVRALQGLVSLGYRPPEASFWIAQYERAGNLVTSLVAEGIALMDPPFALDWLASLEFSDFVDDALTDLLPQLLERNDNDRLPVRRWLDQALMQVAPKDLRYWHAAARRSKVYVAGDPPLAAASPAYAAAPAPSVPPPAEAPSRPSSPVPKEDARVTAFIKRAVAMSTNRVSGAERALLARINAAEAAENLRAPDEEIVLAQAWGTSANHDTLVIPLIYVANAYALMREPFFWYWLGHGVSVNPDLVRCLISLSRLATPSPLELAEPVSQHDATGTGPVAHQRTLSESARRHFANPPESWSWMRNYFGN